MSEYLMYLRKSTLDRDFEDAKGETLARHKAVLTELAEKNGYNVAHIYEEVVSGDSLATRPEMQKCLEAINTGAFDGVLCMDIDRLSRGSSFDSGYISNVLRANDCKVITPQKIYDLNSEYDEQFTDLKFMFARMELRSIAKRTARGRETSAKEGKWIHKKPYGYDIVNIEGTKGKTLAINEKEAEIVRLIFSLSEQGMGYRAIANEMIIRNIPPVEKAWSFSTVGQILKNKVYLGYVPSHLTRVKKVVTGNGVTKRQLVSGDGGWIKGLHEPIITQKQWDIVEVRTKEHTHKTSGKVAANMFAGLLKCKYCGKVMLLGKTSAQAGEVQRCFECRTPQCPTSRTILYKVENEVMKQVEDRLHAYEISLNTLSKGEEDKIYTQKLNALKKALNDAQSRQTKICEYLESGAYTLEMFQKRNEVIQAEIDRISSDISSLKKPEENTAYKELPQLLDLCAIYWEMPVERKNQFLKAIIKEITYDRTTRKEEPILTIVWKD